MTRHLVSSDDLTSAEQAALVARASKLKKARRDHPRSLEGRSVAMIFEKPSTRTRVSFEVAVAELGAHAVVLKTDEIQLGRGETVADTARVLSRFVDAVVIRTFGQEPLRELAKASSVPVVNALSDFEHPCQALADVMTIGERFGELASVRLCYLGDGNNNVCHSLLLAGAKAGLAHIEVAAPWGYQPDPGILRRAREIGASTGTEVTVSGDPAAAADADVLYTDVWVSMGQDADRDERLAAFRGFGVTAQRLAWAAPGAIAMHCLPAHRGEEIDADVIDGQASAVWDQAENRLHTAKAVLEWLLAGEARGGVGH